MAFPSEETLQDRQYWVDLDTTREDIGKFLLGFYSEDPTAAELELTVHALSVTINDPDQLRVGGKHPRTNPPQFGIKYHPDPRTSINPLDHASASEQDFFYLTSGSINVDPVTIERTSHHLPDIPTDAFNRTFIEGAKRLPVDILNLFRRGNIYVARFKLLPVFEPNN